MMVRVIEESAPSLAMTVRTAPYRDDAEIEAMMTGSRAKSAVGC